MKKIIFVVTFLVALSAQAVETPQYKGFEAVNTLLKERMMKRDSKFDLEEYFTITVNGLTTKGDLVQLLGYYDGGGNSAQFKNGRVNVTNVLLWQLLISAFSKDIGMQCQVIDAKKDPTAALVEKSLSDVAKRNIQKLCKWPAQEAQDSTVLKEFWSRLASFDSPPSEYAAWKDFVQKELTASTAADALAAMTTAILMNPHILIRK